MLLTKKQRYMEEWKDVPNYEGIYQASNLGNVRSTPNKTTFTEKHGVRHWKTRTLKTRGKNKSGYRVSLWKDGKSKDYLIARIVAETFLGKPTIDDATVNHKDGNRFNNNIENLEWLTRGDNIRYGFDNNQYPCYSITITSQFGDRYSFRSYKQCSEFLGRNCGYIWLKIKRHSYTVSSDCGIVYQIDEF